MCACCRFHNPPRELAGGPPRLQLISRARSRRSLSVAEVGWLSRCRKVFSIPVHLCVSPIFERFERVDRTSLRASRGDFTGAVWDDGEAFDEAGSGASSQAASSFDYLELEREGRTDNKSVDVEEDLRANCRVSMKNKKVLRREKSHRMRRSSILAKQVISIRTARSLGFVSQLWVDTREWSVVVVEVRPHMLSGEVEKFLLEDISQVGDVVLVHDEGVLANELEIFGLDTLVGYQVVTSSKQTFAKVRGYTFDINSGALHSLELDGLGIAIIPSTLVSTYCLFVKDILQVVADKVIVDEDSESNMQRLSKGIFDATSARILEDEKDWYSSYERNGAQKLSPSIDFDLDYDNWELPLEY